MSISGPGGGPEPLVIYGADDPETVDRFNAVWEGLSAASTPAHGEDCICALPNRRPDTDGGPIAEAARDAD